MKRTWQGLVLLMLLSASCSGDDMEVLLGRAECVMEERPDSALMLVRSIDRRRITRDKTLAHYALCYSQALDKNYIDVDNDSLARIAVDFYLEHGTPHQRSLALYYLGRVYDNAGDEIRAVDAIISAEVFSRELRHTEPYLRGLICHAAGRRYEYQQGHEEAFAFYKESERAFLDAGRLFNAGMACREQAEVCVSCGEWALAATHLRRGIGYGAQSKAHQGLLDSWKRLLLLLDAEARGSWSNLAVRHRVMAEYAKVDTTEVSLRENIFLATLYGRLHHADSTRLYINRVLTLTSDNPAWRAWACVRLSDVERELGNYRKALEYHQDAKDIEDQITRSQSAYGIQTLNRHLEAEQMKSAYMDLRVRHRYQTVIVLLSLLLAGALIGWLIRMSRVWQRRVAEQQEISRQGRDELVQRLSGAYDELKGQYDHLQEERDSERAFTDERHSRFVAALETRLTGLKQLVEYAHMYKNKPTTFFQSFSSFVTVSPSAKKNKKEMWSDLQCVVNEKYHGLVDYLREHHPSLNEADLDLCCLICFGFSPVGICFVYGYEDVGSLYNKRSRLRRKLDLDEDQRLESFLAELSQRLETEAVVREGVSGENNVSSANT